MYLLPPSLLLALLALPLLPSCNSLTLYSRAASSPAASPTSERVLVSGDFVITSNLPERQIAGDGQDEQTTWDFDFKTEATDYVLQKSATLQSATLTLEIEPNGENNGVLTLMQGKEQLFAMQLVNLFPNLPDRTLSKVKTELPLAETNDEEQSLGSLIEQIIQSGSSLAFRYDDDARISMAKIKLQFK